MELSENVAYKPVQSIEMKANEAYQFVGQYWLSNTSECGILRYWNFDVYTYLDSVK